MARDEATAVGVVAVCERHAEVGGDARGGGDARHDAHRHALLLQVLQLLSAPSEDRRIAPLEPHDGAPGGRKVQHERVDLLLRPRVQARLLAYVQHRRVLVHEREDLRRDQPVVQQQVGRLHETQRLHGKQLDVSRADAHQVNHGGARLARGLQVQPRHGPIRRHRDGPWRQLS